jgi:hypothetical protein
MNYLKVRKSGSLFSSKGNVESFLTILPQVVIFLISLQLVFLALNRNIGGYLDQKEIAQTAIGVSNQQDYERFPMAGGGELLIRNREVNQQNLLSYFWPSKVKLLSIVVDESSIQ